jgi:hypothetical protein
MTLVHAATDTDRLPWLTDDLPPKSRGGIGGWLGWALAGTMAVGGLSFWLGMNADRFSGATDPVEITQPDATVAAPQQELIVPAPEAQPVMPQVEPAPVPPPIALPRSVEVAPARVAPRRLVRRQVQIRTATVNDDNLRETVKVQEDAAKAEAAKKAAANKAWNPWESAGAEGRMVRIGTFRTRSDAKRAWTKLVKLYPGMKTLRAVTNDIPSARNGRTYYRLQFGTTSQAHSEVLCQRMKTIGQSCVVVDLTGARARNQDDGQPVGL